VEGSARGRGYFSDEGRGCGEGGGAAAEVGEERIRGRVSEEAAADEIG